MDYISYTHIWSADEMCCQATRRRYLVGWVWRPHHGNVPNLGFDVLFFLSTRSSLWLRKPLHDFLTCKWFISRKYLLFAATVLRICNTIIQSEADILYQHKVTRFSLTVCFVYLILIFNLENAFRFLASRWGVCCRGNLPSPDSGEQELIVSHHAGESGPSIQANWALLQEQVIALPFISCLNH